MKQLAVALAAIGLTASLGAYAALPTGAQATEVNVPQNQGGFFVGGSALYWQPTVSGNNLDYATTDIVGYQDYDGPNQRLKNINPTYNWGFDVFAGYNFGNGNDVELEYLRLHTNDNSSTLTNDPAHYTAINQSHIYADLPAVDTDTSFDPYDTYASGYGKAKINLDEGDLTVGQYFNIGCSDQVRLFAGLRYAELQRKLSTNYSQDPDSAGNTSLGLGVTTASYSGVLPSGAGNSVAVSNGALHGYDDSDFKGIGPIIGLNNSYYLGYGVGFIAGMDTGLLIGDVDDDLYLTNTQAALAFTPDSVPGINDVTATGGENITTTHISSDDARRVVPVIDAKLGLDYTYPFQSYGSLTLEAGWNVTHFWNAVDSLGGVAADAVLIADSDRFASHKEASIGYQGPYVTLTYRATPTV
jgi:hypothetical protein